MTRKNYEDAALALLLSIFVLYIGFIFEPADPSFSKYGILTAFFAAAAWAVGSIGAPPVFSNHANLFAAMFASMSVGFSAPADKLCPQWGFQVACILHNYALTFCDVAGSGLTANCACGPQGSICGRQSVEKTLNDRA